FFGDARPRAAWGTSSSRPPGMRAGSPTPSRLNLVGLWSFACGLVRETDVLTHAETISAGFAWMRLAPLGPDGLLTLRRLARRGLLLPGLALKGGTNLLRPRRTVPPFMWLTT